MGILSSMGRLGDALRSIWGMNTLAKQSFWLLVLFVAGYAFFRSIQKPIPPDPVNEPVAAPLGGIHCLLLGDSAIRSYREAWTTPPSAADWGAAREKILGDVHEAERECSVASSDREREGIEAMRRALALVTRDLAAQAAAPPAPGTPPSQPEVAEHLARARERLR